MPFNESCFNDGKSYLSYDEHITPLSKMGLLLKSIKWHPNQILIQLTFMI